MKKLKNDGESVWQQWYDAEFNKVLPRHQKCFEFEGIYKFST